MSCSGLTFRLDHHAPLLFFSDVLAASRIHISFCFRSWSSKRLDLWIQVTSVYLNSVLINIVWEADLLADPAPAQGPVPEVVGGHLVLQVKSLGVKNTLEIYCKSKKESSIVTERLFGLIFLNSSEYFMHTLSFYTNEITSKVKSHSAHNKGPLQGKVFPVFIISPIFFFISYSLWYKDIL